MTNPFPSPMDALGGLLEERTRYEGWLAQLEAHSSGAPTHVLDRVRGDYEERLHVVLEQLRSRASDLEESAAGMQERITALLAEETARRDERAEAELRAAVGEFSSEYAHDLLARCDEAIDRLFSERSAVSSELGRVQEILALVRRPAEEKVSQQAASPPAPAARPVAEKFAPPFAPSAPTLPAASPAAPATAAAAAAQAAPSPTPLVAPEGESFDELAFLQSVVPPRPAPAVPKAGDYLAPPPLAGVRRPAKSAPAEGTQPESGGAATSRTAAATPSEALAFLKDTPAEQSKTLKCQECGTMNYATEWYCERCGGELAAM